MLYWQRGEPQSKERREMEATMKKELIRVKVEDLIPYERNPRKIPQQAIDDVKESYRQCGIIDPIEIDENNVILSGHTRRLAAIDMGIAEVDALRVVGMTEAQKRKYRLLANKTGERSGWDYELLDWELEDLDFEGYDFGFTIDDLDLFADTEELKDDNYAPPENKELICPACGHRDTAVRFKKA